jgi:hypothetical protein
MPDLLPSKETEVSDLSEFINTEELTIVTQEALSQMYGDPEEDSYYTPQQLKRITISRMVEENEIWGTIDQNNILRLECDSDTFRLAIEWVINLNTKEVFIHD